MEKFELTRQDLKSIYDQANDSVKELIDTKFPTYSLKKIADRIFSLEDACKYNGTTIDEIIPFANPKNDKQKCINAFASMIEIVQAFNEGVTPDWKNSSQYKYYPWWYLSGSSGSGLSLDDVVYVDSSAAVASRLCLLNEDHARIISDRFFSIYEPLMTQK